MLNLYSLLTRGLQAAHKSVQMALARDFPGDKI